MTVTSITGVETLILMSVGVVPEKVYSRVSVPSGVLIDITYIIGIGCCEYRGTNEPCGDQKYVVMHASVIERLQKRVIQAIRVIRRRVRLESGCKANDRC